MRKTLLFLVLLIITGCIESPDIDIRDIRLEGIAQGEIKIKLLVDINNPNNFGVTLKKIDYKMYFENMPLGSGTWEGEELLEGKSVRTLPFSLSVDREMLMRVFSIFFKGKAGDIQSKFAVDVKAVLKKFGKSYTYAMNWKYKDKHKDEKEGKEGRDRKEQKERSKDDKDGKDKKSSKDREKQKDDTADKTEKEKKEPSAGKEGKDSKDGQGAKSDDDNKERGQGPEKHVPF